MATTSNKIGVVILAAGASKRMGSPKQLLEVGGCSLIERSVDAALASKAWPVVVVLGAYASEVRAALLRKPVLIVENSTWSEGMASSIRSGIGAIRQFSRSMKGAVIALCDQPAFDEKAISLLIETQNSTKAMTVAARYSGRLGAPVLFMSEQFDSLEKLTGEEGARTLINADTKAVGVDLPQLAFDLDTPTDVSSYKNG